MFSSRSFVVSGLTFQSLIHFQLIFKYHTVLIKLIDFHVKPTLPSWDTSFLVSLHNLFTYCWIDSPYQYLADYLCACLHEPYWSLTSFYWLSPSGFAIMMKSASSNDLKSVPSLLCFERVCEGFMLILLKCLVEFTSKVMSAWHFLCGKFLITNPEILKKSNDNSSTCVCVCVSYLKEGWIFGVLTLPFLLTSNLFNRPSPWAFHF